MRHTYHLISTDAEQLAEENKPKVTTTYKVQGILKACRGSFRGRHEWYIDPNVLEFAVRHVFQN